MDKRFLVQREVIDYGESFFIDYKSFDTEEEAEKCCNDLIFNDSLSDNARVVDTK